MSEPLCSKCGTETEWKEYLRCPNCYLRLPVVQQLRERIEQLEWVSHGELDSRRYVDLDDVLKAIGG